MFLAFPAFKIMLLLVKQIAKPIAGYVKTQAKEHPALRSNIIRFAQSYHRLEIRLKRRQIDAAKPENSNIIPLDDSKAIDLAANFIGETIIFSTAVAVVVIEAYRKRLDDREKLDMRSNEITQLETRVRELEARLESISQSVDQTRKKSWLSSFGLISAGPSQPSQQSSTQSQTTTRTLHDNSTIVSPPPTQPTAAQIPAVTAEKSK